ncbi:unnamed protein product [Cylindrotheca closterium]|uniref:Globin domain-containing protein n=1 Tax=Cylindrotheca closterium TaxID=2856 RepID=A0AAD2CKA9_9STRA|nr:unnamed protein product [Cylindrotheca closterium]
MVHDMSYNTVSNVIATWEKVRQVKDYEHVVGTQLFQKFFASTPNAMTVFGFPKGSDPSSKDSLENPRFVKKAKWFIRVFIQMIERSLDMLGPDSELLTEILLELGQRHVRYGVDTSYYPAMGKVLLVVLDDVLDEKTFTPQVRKDWEEVYTALYTDMIEGHNMVNV